MSLKTQYTGRYELDDEFWSAEIKGKIVTIHFGKIGTAGHIASREFGSLDAAKKFVEDRLRSKIAKGFVLISETTQLIIIVVISKKLSLFK